MRKIDMLDSLKLINFPALKRSKSDKKVGKSRKCDNSLLTMSPTTEKVK